MALVTRRRIALSSPEWKTIPWRKLHKTSKDILFDILGDVSGVLEDFDRIGALDSQSARDEGYAQLATQCWLIDSSLTWWSENVGPGHHMDAIIERGGYEAPTPEDAAVVYIMTHYWTACVLLYTTLRQCLSLGAASSTCSSPAADELLCLPERTVTRVYCKSIIDATDVLHHPSAGAFGAHSMVFPLSIAAANLLAMEGLGEEESISSPEMVKLLSLFDKGDAGRKLRKLMYAMFRNAAGSLQPLDEQREPVGSDIQQMAEHSRIWYGLDKQRGA